MRDCTLMTNSGYMHMGDFTATMKAKTNQKKKEKKKERFFSNMFYIVSNSISAKQIRGLNLHNDLL